MQVNIALPKDVSRAFEECWGDMSRHTLEAIALEGYQSGTLTESQVRRRLGFETRMDVHASSDVVARSVRSQSSGG